MVIRIYAQRRNREAMERLRDALAAGDGAPPSILCGDARYFRARDADRSAEVVYHDGTVPALVEAYEAMGADVRPLEAEDDAPDTPEVVEAPQGPREGYEVVHNGPWFTLLGPDGEKVGVSQRSEAEAWAQLEADHADD